MNRDKRYMKSMNTFGLLALPKEMPLYSRASLKNLQKIIGVGIIIKIMKIITFQRIILNFSTEFILKISLEVH